MHPRLALTILALVLAAQPAVATPPTHIWSQGHGGTLNDQAFAVVHDPLGNIYVTGIFQGTASFGGGNLVAAGSNDVFAAKYGPDGAHLWSAGFGGSSSDQGQSVAALPDGSFYLAGYFNLSINLGGSALVSAGGVDIYLAKFGPTGTHIWSKRFGSTQVDVINDLAVTADGGVVAVGQFEGSVDFGGGVRVATGGRDAFVARFDGDGNHVFSLVTTGPGTDNAETVALDAAGDIFVAGTFTSSIDLGGGVLVGGGSTDIFLARFNGSGVHLWSLGFGGIDSQAVEDLAIDADGNLLLAGYFDVGLDFGGGSLSAVAARDAYLAKLDPYGAHIWSTQANADDTASAQGVAVDARGDVYWTGSFRGTVDFGGGPISFSGQANSTDIFLAKLAGSDGGHRWGSRFGGPETDAGRGVSVGPHGDPVMMGTYRSDAWLGLGFLPYSGSIENVFVARYSEPLRPFVSSVLDIGNDQGRMVKLRFERSGRDHALATSPITRYDVYRRNDPLPGKDEWTFVGSAPAHAEASYGLDVPTLADSTVAHGQHLSSFFVRAATATPANYFDSLPASGYSVDNLSPSVPLGFKHDAGILSWEFSDAPDFAYFTVYGGHGEDFAQAVVVDQPSTARLDVAGQPYAHYFVSSTDEAGNESGFASLKVEPNGGGTPSRFVLSLTNHPNPFNPSTAIRYTLPVSGHVRVHVHDARGRLLVQLVDAEQEAGAHSLTWDGRGADGSALGSGVYFARIEQAGATRTRKLVLLK